MATLHYTITITATNPTEYNEWLAHLAAAPRYPEVQNWRQTNQAAKRQIILDWDKLDIVVPPVIQPIG